jgi:hypothetical protein
MIFCEKITHLFAVGVLLLIVSWYSPSDAHDRVVVIPLNGGGENVVHCDGNPYGGIINDACGVCGGNGSSCTGCDGIPNSGEIVDACGVCGGDGSSCSQDDYSGFYGTFDIVSTQCGTTKDLPFSLIIGNDELKKCDRPGDYSYVYLPSNTVEFECADPDGNTSIATINIVGNNITFTSVDTDNSTPPETVTIERIFTFTNDRNSYQGTRKETPPDPEEDLCEASMTVTGSRIQ